jgi:hypothetical protein
MGKRQGSGMEILFTKHGYSSKIEREIPKRVIKKTVKKAKLPKGNYKTYIYNKEHRFYIVGSKYNGVLKVITIVTDALNGMNIYGQNSVIRIV